jgi:protein SCO1/2
MKEMGNITSGRRRLWARKTPPAIGAASLATVFLLGGCLSLQESPREAEAPHIARTSLFRHPWVWTDELGSSVTFADWRGQPLVVTAMFTSCRATCPRTMKKLRDLQTAMTSQGRSAQFLLVTLDPTNDTPARLRAFKESQELPAAWHFLSGTPEETQELADVLDIHLLAADSHLIHDGRIVMFDEQGMPTRSFSGYSLDDEAPLL